MWTRLRRSAKNCIFGAKSGGLATTDILPSRRRFPLALRGPRHQLKNPASVFVVQMRGLRSGAI